MSVCNCYAGVVGQSVVVYSNTEVGDLVAGSDGVVRCGTDFGWVLVGVVCYGLAWANGIRARLRMIFL